jgi:hypothetical protein
MSMWPPSCWLTFNGLQGVTGAHGSIPDVIEFFGRTMALGSTQPLTEMSTRKLQAVKAAGA